ncbi:MAG: DUF1761 domain-containing protein [Saprospiraceae bacterium]
MENNFIALVVAALVPMVLGFIWYHPKLFGTAWMRSAGLTDEILKTGNMAVIFGVSFLMSIMLAFVMNVIGYHDSFVAGAMYYATNGTMIPEAGSELAKWFEYYQSNLAESNHTFKHGAFHGASIAGIFIVLPITVFNALFERKGFKYMAINAGFWIVSLSLMGGIIASWH